MKPATIVIGLASAFLLHRALSKRGGASVPLVVDISSALPKPDVFPDGWDVVWEDAKATPDYSYKAQVLQLRSPDPESAFVYVLKGHNAVGTTADGWGVTGFRREADSQLGDLISELASNVA